MDKLPSIVVVSSSNTKPKSLIKLITKEKDIKEDKESKIIVQPWDIDTKYYNVTVNIIGIDEKYERTQEFNDNVEAIIILMDTNKETGIKDLNTWNDLLRTCDPDIKLLVANYCTNDTKIKKANALKWCLEQQFEFIELYPTIKKPETDDEVIRERYGIDRIIEALETHIWPHLKMKKEYAKTAGKKSAADEGEMGIDDFSELFAQMHMFRDSLQSMPSSQRKQCAEQLVSSFWEAMGGVEEELLDV